MDTVILHAKRVKHVCCAIRFFHTKAREAPDRQTENKMLKMLVLFEQAAKDPSQEKLGSDSKESL